jgi:periplasmic protein TonB
VLIGLWLFVIISVGLHFTMGSGITALSPVFRTPDTPDQTVAIVTLSRGKVEIIPPTPTPPPKVVKRTIANIAPMKYLEFGSHGPRRGIKPPARRTSMLAVHGHEAAPAPGPDAAAATDVTPATAPKHGDSAQADSGADNARVAGAVVWGDDNPPRLLSLAALGANADTNAHHVRLEVDVGPDGNVTSVRVLSSSGDAALDAAAMDAVRKSTFAPATLNGLPVHGTCIVDVPAASAGPT